jgi:hypothetical protein
MPLAGEIIHASDVPPDWWAAPMVVFTASGSLTAADVAGARGIRVRVWGAGGGGGGCAATAAGNTSAGPGGGGGGYAESVLSVASLVLPVTVTVGAGGLGGAAGGVGGAGGTSSFGGLVVATGGGAAQAGPTGTAVGVAALGGPGGQGTVGQLVLTGGGGRSSVRFAVTNHPPGEGGMAAAGSGNVNTPYPGGAATAPGTTGHPGGAGGGGGYNGAGQAAQIGGAGGSGLVVVELIFA